MLGQINDKTWYSYLAENILQWGIFQIDTLIKFKRIKKNKKKYITIMLNILFISVKGNKIPGLIVIIGIIGP